MPVISDDAPGRVTGLEAERDGDDIELTWTKPSGTVTGYKIEVRVDNRSWTVEEADTERTTTTYTHTDVDDNKRYRYRVSAINDEGTGRASLQADVPAVEDDDEEEDDNPVKPGAPTALSAKLSHGGIALAWAAPADEGSSSLTSYRVGRSANGSTGWTTLTTVGPTVTSYTDTEVGPNTMAHYRVFAITKHGESAASNTAKATTGRDLPTAPRNLSVENERDGNRLTWVVPADTGSASITGYRVERSTDTGASWTSLIHADPGALSFLHRGASPGQEIHYRVIAINKHGDGPPSNAVSITTPAIPPSRPGNLRASPDGSLILLSWNEPREDGGAEVTGYQIDVAVKNGAWYTVIDNTETTETSYTFKAEPGSTLSFRVYAINSAQGAGSSSNVLRVIVEATVPDAPLGVGALAQSHTAIGIAWNPSG